MVLPRRVLTFSQDAEGIKVYLQENSNLIGRYIALSHCWGSTQSCITTSQNISERKKSIPWKQLSRTFQDAITYSLQLETHYLWVDALCILQDQTEDWQIESAKMGDIYQNAYVTLAATASRNGDGGCFSSFENRGLAKEYELDSCQSSNTSIIVREKIQHWSIPPTATTLEHHPLLTRGWTFQERLLSPRVVHFCEREVVWECNGHSVCECRAGATPNTAKQFSELLQSPLADQRTSVLPRRSRWNLRAKMIAKTTKFRQSRLSVTDRNGLADEWHQIVAQYSALRLTKESDRLPALSGLAQRVSPHFGTYLAGLWSETTVQDLMWRVNNLNAEHRRPATYQGPSWSWVSVAGAVSYWSDSAINVYLEEVVPWIKAGRDFNLRYDILHRALSRVGTIDKHHSFRFQFLPVDHRVESTSQNLYGSVTSGSISLSRHILPACLQYVYTRQGLGSSSGRRELDKVKYEISLGHIELPFFADYILCEEGPHHLKDRSRLYLLALHPDICLVLKQATSSVGSRVGIDAGNDSHLSNSTYERVGIVRQPNTLLDTYLLDWMAASKQELVTII